MRRRLELKLPVCFPSNSQNTWRPFTDEGELTNPSTELSATMPDGLLNELSGSIHEKLEAKQRRQSTIPPDKRKET
jgi:hypothetical protein